MTTLFHSKQKIETEGATFREDMGVWEYSNPQMETILSMDETQIDTITVSEGEGFVRYETDGVTQSIYSEMIEGEDEEKCRKVLDIILSHLGTWSDEHEAFDLHDGEMR